MKVERRKVANVNYKVRVKQMLILVIVILVGVIISFAAHAQDFHKAKKKHFLEKYKFQMSHGNSCHILNKKRYTKHRTVLFASHHRKPKSTPQAEVDNVAPSHTPKFRRNDPVMATN